MTASAGAGAGQRLGAGEVREMLHQATEGPWRAYNRGREIVSILTPDIINDQGAEECQTIASGRIWSDADHILLAAAPDIAAWGLEQHATAEAEAARAAVAEARAEAAEKVLDGVRNLQQLWAGECATPDESSADYWTGRGIAELELRRALNGERQKVLEPAAALGQVPAGQAGGEEGV